MLVAATLSLLAVLTPQGTQSTGQEPEKPKLGDREIKALSDRLRDYLAAEAAYDAATESKEREKTGKKRLDLKGKFEDEWDRAEKKVNLLASMPDLRAIFFNCFERGKPGHSKGQLIRGKFKIQDDDIEYSSLVPKQYRESAPHMALLTLPPAMDGGSWAKASAAFHESWKDDPLLEQSILAIPQLPDGLEMDPVPDYNREGAEQEEDRRNRTVLGTLGQVMADYNVDRARVFLECGRGSSGYGVRLVTLFPDRFAGVVLRDPVAVDDLRLGSLVGTPFLLFKTGDNAAVVDALQKRIEEKAPGAVTIVEAKGAYPYKENNAEVLQWMVDKQRNMSPRHVVLEPNHDRFNRAYWVDILTAESLLTTTGDKRPRLEVKADREANRITVDAVGVERFELVLNDELVDLDKEFAVVINGKAVQETRRRSFTVMKKGVIDRSDWGYLFPVTFSATVPKE